MSAANVVWLVCCVVAVLAGVVWVVVVAIRRSRPARPAGPDRSARLEVVSLPDFAVVDQGDQIHFVPLHETGHLLESGRCPCLPRRTLNHRRSGRRVVYHDHHSLGRRSAIP